RVPHRLTQRRKDTGCVKHHVRADGKNDDRDETCKQGSNASTNTPRTMHFAHDSFTSFSLRTVAQSYPSSLGAPDTDSTLIAPPHPREGDWHIPKGGPAWLRLHPAIVDDLLTQFGELPARRERRLRVVGQQMHMRIDCDRLAIGCLEVRRHPCCHDEEGMKSNEHIRRATPAKPRRFHV